MKVLMFLFAGLASIPVLRADGESLSVSPSVVMLRGQVGQSTTQTLSFTNGMSQPLSFEMTALDGVVRDGKRLFVEAGTQAGSIAATATFSPKVFTAAPGQTVRINVTVTIPPKPGGRAIAVMCQGTTKIGTGARSPRMTASVGTLLTFAISGDVIAATASPLLVEPPTPSSNFVAAQQLSNSGTEPVEATGMMVIVNGGGTLVGKQAIPAWRMLPGEKTDVRVEYADDLPPGRYRALITYDLSDKALTSSAEFIVR